MNIQAHISFNSESWKQLYRAAILQQDDTIISERITPAEYAIVARVRELFTAGGDHRDELEALDDALYALHALRSSCKSRSDED